MESICTLNGLGGALSSCRGILTASLTAHHGNFWVLPHPPCRGICLSIREQIDRAMALEIHENRAEPLTTPEGKIVDAQIQHRSSSSVRQVHHPAQDGVARGLYTQTRGQSGPSFATGCQPDRGNLLAVAAGHSGPWLHKGWQTLCEDFPLAVGVTTGELANHEDKLDLTARTGRITQAPAIVTMDR